ncbi:hypothetical protein BBJ28_00014775, partial [Nothophytophthora sp. Chile5]
MAGWDSYQCEDDGNGAPASAHAGGIEALHEIGAAAKTYLTTLTTQSGLCLLQQAEIKRAFEDKGERGLFSLFVDDTIKSAWRRWTNQELQARGDEPITVSELDAYLGLELAMSLCPLSGLAEFWCGQRFMGQCGFAETMAQSRFQLIRGTLKTHPLEWALSATSHPDSLGHSRGLLEHFQRKFASIAVPFGVSTLDETTVHTKARMGKGGSTRFYAVVGWESQYVHSIWDDGSGSTLPPPPPAHRYTNLFPELRTPLDRTLVHPDVTITPDSATALWLAMIGHQTRLMQSPTGRRLLICENFYTRHVFAKAVLAFTDGDVKVLGTVRMDLVDRWNKPELKEAFKRVHARQRGAWELVGAVDPDPEWEKRQQEHRQEQSKLPPQQRTKFKPQLMASPNAGFIVFLDKQVVVFYTNDLAKTPRARVLTDDSDEAAVCCHGLYPLQRWADTESMTCTTLMVPTIIVAYNNAMNGVDRVNQLRHARPTHEREKPLELSLLTWVLDLAVINAYALQRKLKSSGSAEIPLREFKRRLSEALTESEMLVKARLDRQRTRNEPETVADVVGTNASAHILTPNVKA